MPRLELPICRKYTFREEYIEMLKAYEVENDEKYIFKDLVDNWLVRYLELAPDGAMNLAFIFSTDR